MAVDLYRTRKIEAVEKQRKVNWEHFSMTRKGMMSWANWFIMRRIT
jgi:hypothetical protein